MRKDAVQARGDLRALGYVHTSHDTSGHEVWTHQRGAQVKLSLTPSDVNAHIQAVRSARQQLGLKPAAAATKRRPAAERRAEAQRARNLARQAEQRARDQEAATRTEAARRVTESLARDAELTALTTRIRDLTAALRRCQTPQARREIELQVIPLVQQRQAMLGVVRAAA